MNNRPSSKWKNFIEMLFDRGGAEAVFAHARNLIIATLIVAAGTKATSQEAVWPLWGVLSVKVAGYTVAIFGTLLLGLNLFDGLRKLARANFRFLFQALLMLAYLLITIRVAQLVVAFRYPTAP